MNLKNKLRGLIPPEHIFTILHWKKTLPFLGGAAFKSYSGNGEDIILTQYLFTTKQKGFYVDIGSFHPKIISNTYLLHKRGWKGINIDPNPKTHKLFERARPNDINLKLGVAGSSSEKDYYNFSYSGANTFDETFGEQKTNKPWNTLLSKDKLHCEPLKTIFKTHLPENTGIDLLDVDVEGLDLEVLKSNDWNLYRPSVILVEDKKFRTSPGSSEVYLFLKEQGYLFHSYMDITLIMTEKDFQRK